MELARQLLGSAWISGCWKRMLRHSQLRQVSLRAISRKLRLAMMEQSWNRKPLNQPIAAKPEPAAVRVPMWCR